MHRLAAGLAQELNSYHERASAAGVTISRVPPLTEIQEVPTWRNAFDQYHYHYTTAEAAFEYILPSRQLRLSPYPSMRDPLETKAWEFVFAEGESPLVRRVLPILIEGFHKNIYMLCLGCDVGQLVSQRGYGRARMWEQYGDRSRGVCLCFRHGLLKATMMDNFPDTLKAGPVVYQPGGFHTTAARYLKSFDLDQVLMPFLAPGQGPRDALSTAHVADLKLAKGVGVEDVQQVLGKHVTDRWLTHFDIHMSSVLVVQGLGLGS
ncbi:MAG: hypothetical protein JWR63_1536 [Conexibacter sp.]|nr:hypothetical protein [Conexibacter sp.]